MSTRRGRRRLPFSRRDRVPPLRLPPRGRCLAAPPQRGGFVRQRWPPEPEVGPQKIAAGDLVDRQAEQLRSDG
jgi:hypothetical protein